MARFCTLFSGSGGNCTYIGSGGTGLLIDAGVSARRIQTALTEREIDPASIAGIFVTHEHVDHVQGIKVLTKRFGFPVYASRGTLDAMAAEDRFSIGTDIREITDTVAIGDMQVTMFHTSHDSAESVGYAVETAVGRKMAVCTDTGVLTNEALAAITGCDLIQMESNHDVHMLQNGVYPYALKQRILSAHGHLSNEACATVLPQLAEQGTTRFILSHLSKENNTPMLARDTAIRSLSAAGLTGGIDYLLKVAAPICEERWTVL